MGSAKIQGELWGKRAEDYATYLEQVSLPLFGAALDAAHVTPGTRLLDAGCGSGLLALLASFRGGLVSAIDASAALVDIAQKRLPNAEIRVGDLEALPFPDGSFDAAVAVNSVFYAANPEAATRAIPRRTDGWPCCSHRMGTARAMRVPIRSHASNWAIDAATPAWGSRCTSCVSVVATRRSSKAPKECWIACVARRRNRVSFYFSELRDLLARKCHCRSQPGGNCT